MALSQAVPQESATLAPFADQASRDRLPLPSALRATRNALREATGPGGVTYMPGHNPLEQLIRRRAAELDLTILDLAKRGGMSNSTLHSLLTKAEHRQPPRPATLAKLAKALSVPLDVVRAAAAEAAGYTIEEITGSENEWETLRVIVAAHQKLSDADRRKLMRLAEAFVEESRAAAGVETPTPRRRRSSKSS